MTAVTKTLVFLVGATAWQCLGADSANPYQSIVERNVFVLKPIPPPPPPPEPPKPPAPPITLNGITTILGNKRALLSYSSAAKPGEPAKPTSVILAENQRDGDVEVVEIDEKAGSVKVNAFGMVSTLTFKDNGAKLASGPAPAAFPNPVSGGAPPAPNPNPFAPPGAAGFNKTIPGRTLRLPTAPAQGAQGGMPGAAGSANPAFGGFPGQSSVQGPIAPEANRTPEEDVILTELDRERHRNDPKYPPLPPTPLTSQEDLKQIMAPGWENSTRPKNLQPQ